MNCSASAAFASDNALSFNFLPAEAAPSCILAVSAISSSDIIVPDICPLSLGSFVSSITLPLRFGSFVWNENVSAIWSAVIADLIPASSACS